MHIEPISAPVQSQIDEFHSYGGVVDYICVRLDERDGAGFPDFRQAALIAVAELERRDQIEDRQMSPQARLSKLEGTRINGVEFLGPLWARNRETLIVRGRESPNVWFYANDPQIAANAVDHIYFSDANSGYAYAFSRPPYGLRCPAECQVNLFRQITASLMPHVLPLSDGAVHIYRWNTDWSPYFEAGREWWGEFLWTVWWPGQTIVVVAASATD